ncbi:MAG TPA: thiamine diphosphokinase, partial [Desulfobacteria bacterium]|nr:thiamine diphosphokinase [Desulfobacteria bacterium]
MTKERVLIFSGGTLGRWALDEVREDDFLIGADRGGLFLVENNLQPDFVIGDFDSLTSEELLLVRENCTGIISCDPVNKDYTDTEMAFNWALQKKPSEIVLLGVTGTRLDHTLANIHLLKRGLT